MDVKARGIHTGTEPSTQQLNGTEQDSILTRVNELCRLTADEEAQVMKLAAVGLLPRDIAVAMEWPRERRRAFCALAEFADTEIANLIASGRAVGRAQPQIKLQEAAAAGNVEAVKALQALQAANRFNELLTLMDDDEFTVQTFEG